MVWHILKYWAAFFIPTFYKRVQARNIKNLRIKGPVIIAMNHPNAFTDPVAITYVSYPQRLKYLARGDAFKPGPVTWLLEQIGIIPIFRIQDGGKEGLKKNDESYVRVNALLKKNAKVIVFTEGLCIQERRLRPLKKGAARMVFGAWDAIQNEALKVVPVGINYSQPDKFRSTLFYNVGEPILVKDFIAGYKENPAKAYNIFLQTLEPKMKELITHIDKKENDNAVYCAEALCKKNMLKAQKLNYKNLYHDYLVTKQITGVINATAVHQQPLLDEFSSKATAYFSALKKNKLRNWLIDPQQNRYVNWFCLILRYLLLALGSPLYLLGLIGNYLPLRLSARMPKKVAKAKEFYSSFFIAFSMIFFVLNYVLWFTVVYLLAPNILWPALTCVSLALCGWFSLHYYPFALKTFGMARALQNKTLVQTFVKEHEELLSLINKFNDGSGLIWHGI